MTKAIIGSNTETIGNYAFDLCTNLTDLKIGPKVKKIEKCAFQMIGAKQIEIPNSIKKIENRAFSKCKNLIELSIGNGIEDIEEDAFVGCINLKRLVLGNGKEEYRQIDARTLKEALGGSYNYRLQEIILGEEIDANEFLDSWKHWTKRERLAKRVQIKNSQLKGYDINTKFLGKIGKNTRDNETGITDTNMYNIMEDDER